MFENGVDPVEHMQKVITNVSEGYKQNNPTTTNHPKFQKNLSNSTVVRILSKASSTGLSDTMYFSTLRYALSPMTLTLTLSAF